MTERTEYRPFTDWRNRGLVEFELPEMKHVDRFTVIPFLTTEGVESTWFDYPSASGSMREEHSIEKKPSWRHCPAGNWTYFELPEHGDDKRAYFKKLDGYNSGLYVFKWEDKWYFHRQDNWYLCNAITSKLELTPAQKLRVHYLFASERLKRRGVPLELVIFVLASLICNYDGRKCYPHPNTKKYDPLFNEFAEIHNFSPKRIMSLFQKFQDQLKPDLLPERKRKSPTEPELPTWWSIRNREGANSTAQT